VFQQYLSAFMKDVRTIFGLILYSICVTEFQKRGLPHEHIAVAAKNVPRSPQEIDSFLSAELPANCGPLRDAVKHHMTHIHDPKKTYQRLAPELLSAEFNHSIVRHRVQNGSTEHVIQNAIRWHGVQNAN
jgi:hypothetical protein